jgi:Zn-dependent protease
MDDLIYKLAVNAIPFLLAITLHEAAHGYAAKQFGDRTAEMLGRLSLNPTRHIDPIGTLLVPAITLMAGSFFFGWAKAVPVNTNNLRNAKTDMIWVAAAGPFSNFLQAIVWAFIWKFAAGADSSAITAIAQAGVMWNIGLMVLNLLPILPLDGGRIVAGILPRDLSNSFSRLEPYGMFIVLGLALAGMLGTILGPMQRAMGKFLVALIS